ncbi:unnamed protein product [Brachionus calyciflorus]|uniref:Uncharacterized protein n=1 Tax=Brachionus calyciflorus TaxID=104777 RepID=A0A814QJ33_9BILA|nr:unnamed protein product [Brachionus calyciflorus]
MFSKGTTNANTLGDNLNLFVNYSHALTQKCVSIATFFRDKIRNLNGLTYMYQWFTDDIYSVMDICKYYMNLLNDKFSLIRF